MRNSVLAPYAISIAAAEQELHSTVHPEEEGHQEHDNYSVCLEDVGLFAQLEDMTRDCDGLELLTAADNLDLLDLVNGALQQTPNDRTLPISKGKRSRTSHSSKPQSHICHICQRSFSVAYNLRIHKMTHTDEKPHICVACGKGFRQLNKLRIHYVTHTPERPHKCDICGKGFRYANYLTVHRRLHTGEKPYKCQMENCPMYFHSIHTRRVHMKLQHNSTSQSQHEVEENQDQEHRNGDADVVGLVPTISIDSNLSYTCPICNRVLSDQCYLNTHLKRHYNQRDFHCTHPECGKRFYSSSELKHHQISHSQIRPYGCPKCKTRFLRKSNYKQHMKIHER